MGEIASASTLEPKTLKTLTRSGFNQTERKQLMNAQYMDHWTHLQRQQEQKTTEILEENQKQERKKHEQLACSQREAKKVEEEKTALG